jgi:hypothetical protein
MPWRRWMGKNFDVIKPASFLRAPAKAGVHSSAVAGAAKWVPAFAGKRQDKRHAFRSKTIPI